MACSIIDLMQRLLKNVMLNISSFNSFSCFLSAALVFRGGGGGGKGGRKNLKENKLSSEFNYRRKLTS